MARGEQLRTTAPPRDEVQPPATPIPWYRQGDLLLAAALCCLYLALMSGHPHSIDGLIIYREAQALAFDQTLRFAPPLLWGGPIVTSKYGIGLALLYLPGLILWSWLRPFVPTPQNQPYDWGQFYADPLYTVAAAPVHALITAGAAYLVGYCCRELGLKRSTALWGMTLYGLGSPALVYARGDWNQPLTGLCWIGAFAAALRYRRTGAGGALALAAGAIGYAILVRPVEGLLLVPAILLVVTASPPPWRAYGSILAGAALGVGITLGVNALRHGSPFTTGYGDEGWTNPLRVGLAGVLVSPGRGILWAFPAMLLAPLGAWHLWRRGQGQVAVALCGLIGAQVLNVALWHIWWGGWNWGPRLLIPALPLIALLSAAGLEGIAARLRTPVAALILAPGLLWALPAVLTNLFGGYAGAYDGTAGSFRVQAYPPLGAWTFLQHWQARAPTDAGAADILWLRVAQTTNNLSLVPPALLLVLGGFLALRAIRTVGQRHSGR